VWKALADLRQLLANPAEINPLGAVEMPVAIYFDIFNG
jgi:hypothetical protein